MKMNVSFNDFSRICRLCLDIGDLQSVFQENVLKMLGSLADIQINHDDDLPKTICKNCIKEIDSIFSFVTKCKKSHNSLLLITQNKDEISDMQFEIDNFEDYQKEAKDINDKAYTKENSRENLNCQRKRYNTLTPKAGYICKNCKTPFKSRTCLETHYRRNRECRPPNFKIHKCDFCEREFKHSYAKKQHLNVHTGQTSYICTYCGRGFKLQSSFYTHIHRHKVKLGLVKEYVASTENLARLKLKCEKCEKIFASHWGFQQHKKKHEHSGNQIVKVYTNNKSYLCNFCAKTFSIKANLDTHLRIHTGERPFECKDCGRQFKQKIGLNRHALNHLDDRPKPFICDICQKKFTTKAHMEIHRRLHTGEKPYQCNFCAKSFNYKTSWRLHLRMHTGESPFVCHICDNRYNDKGSLRKHQKTKGHLHKEHKVESCRDNVEQSNLHPREKEFVK